MPPLLDDEMSDRNLAEVVAHYTTKHYGVVLNDLYRARTTDLPKAEAIDKVKQNLLVCWYVPLNGISPVDKTAIQDGKYPINRNVYLAVRKQNSPAIKQFVDLALSPQGQQIAQQSDFIPLK